MRAKAPNAPLFSIRDATRLARMLRADLAEARRVWLRECLADLDAYIAREQSDFLADTNHAGQVLDFHALRHTCGTWLALSGAQPKAIQTVMRHSVITLTLDTYGHLLPDQEAEAVAGLGQFLNAPNVEAQAARKTGTDDVPIENPPKKAQRGAQRKGSISSTTLHSTARRSAKRLNTMIVRTHCRL